MGEQQADRDAKGRFAKGHKQLGHRAKGQPNKITKSIRERVLCGFEDSNGDGIADFVKELKRDHPPAAAGLLARMMPASDVLDEGERVTIEVIVSPIMRGNFYAGDRDELVDEATARLKIGMDAHESAALDHVAQADDARPVIDIPPADDRVVPFRVPRSED